MIIVGVTGNTGAGKSTVSTIIKNNTGAVIIDADKIVKEMMVPGEDYFRETVELFGEHILVKSPAKHKGKIDNLKLATALFKDAEKREKLNKITFKYVGQKTKELILANQDKEFIVLDFPLLYEGGFDKICNYVIGVVADEETKISRIKQRDRVSKKQVEARIDAQMNEQTLKETTDFILDNSKDTKYINLVKNTIRVIHKIKKEEEEKKKGENA